MDHIIPPPPPQFYATSDASTWTGTSNSPAMADAVYTLPNISGAVDIAASAGTSNTIAASVYAPPGAGTNAAVLDDGTSRAPTSATSAAMDYAAAASVAVGPGTRPKIRPPPLVRTTSLQNSVASVATQITPMRSYVKKKLAPRLRRLAKGSPKPSGPPRRQKAVVNDSILPISDEPLVDSADFYRQQHQQQQQQRQNTMEHPPPPVRNWSEGLYHNIPNVPVPTHTSLNVTVRNPLASSNLANENPSRSQAWNDVDDDGFQTVGAKKQRKKEQAKARGRPLKGAERPKPIFLFITRCDPQTTADDIEAHILGTFDDATEVSARKTHMSHDDYCSFTAVVKGKDLSLEQLSDPDHWPAMIRVFGGEQNGRRRV